MDKNDYKILMKISRECDRVSAATELLLFRSKDTVPTALGYNEGFFGLVSSLDKILIKYSKCDADTFTEVTTNEKLTYAEMVDILF